VADILTLQVGFGLGLEGLSYPICSEAIRRLHLKSEELDRIRMLLPEEMRRCEDLLNLPETHGQ
jgi:hypothetical protein